MAIVGSLRAGSRVGALLRVKTAPHQPWWYVGALVSGDILASGAGLAAGIVATPPAQRSAALPFVGIALIAWPMLLALRGAYGPRSLGARDEYTRVGRWVVELVALLAVIALVIDRPVPQAAAMVALPVVLLGSLLTRYLVRRRLRTLRRRGLAVRRVLALGTGPGITTFLERLSTNVEHDIVVVGACAEGTGPVVEDVPVIARLPDPRVGEGVVSDDEAVHAVLAAMSQVGADTVCVTGCSLFSGDRMRALGWALAERGSSLVSVSGLVEVATHRLQFGRAGNVSLVHVYPVKVAGLPAIYKHASDRVVAAVGLLVLLPVLAGIGALVRLTSPGPALYRQTRVGLCGRQFTMLKFRTMRVDAEAVRHELIDANEHDGHMFKLRQDPRITKAGGLLRRLSLDELPQLVNVLLGEMSLVGPRPPLPEEVAAYNPVEHRRLLVRPGMTGLWQVSGRSDLSWEETMRLDLRYVDNWSLGLDLSLLWRTGRVVVRGTGAY